MQGQTQQPHARGDMASVQFTNWYGLLTAVVSFVVVTPAGHAGIPLDCFSALFSAGCMPTVAARLSLC